MVFPKDPLSIVVFAPISAFSLIITIPICGYLKFCPFLGKKPKPFLPITAPSKIFTLFSIIVFIITFEPIVQFL